jgi:hypothetical protein
MARQEKKIKRHMRKLDSHKKHIEKQKLSDLEHLISMDAGTFLVLIEEGTSQQIALSKQKAKTTLLKYAPEMYKLAQELGGLYPKTVEDFLNSVDEIVYSATAWIDSAKIKECYKATQKLEKALHKHRKTL